MLIDGDSQRGEQLGEELGFVGIVAVLTAYLALLFYYGNPGPEPAPA